MLKDSPSFILIGAGGFIGGAFSSYLRHKNYEVFNVLKGQIAGEKSDFDFLEGSLKVEGKQHVVVDFAYTSVPNTSFIDPVKDYSENLYNVIRHLEFTKQIPGATYTYISSGGTVYGNSDKCLPITEDHPNAPLSPYGITKLACEKYVLMYKEIYGIDIKIIRPSNVYGPGQRPFRGQGFIATAIAKILQHEPLQIYGAGLQVRDYLYIDDFCRVLFDVIQFGEHGGIYNTGSEVGLTLNQLLDSIKYVVDEPVKVEYLPFRPFDVRYNVLDSAKVKGLNNWRPSVALEDGLNSTISWIKEGVS